jgi:hypothetical protein
MEHWVIHFTFPALGPATPAVVVCPDRVFHVLLLRSITVQVMH